VSEDNVSMVRRNYEAHARGDSATIAAILHPQIDVYQCEQLPWGGHYQGHSGAREFFRRQSEHIDSQIVPEEMIDAGGTVAVTGRLRGQVRSTGRAFDLLIVHIWTVRDGQIVRFEAYTETPRLLRALASQPTLTEL